MTLTALADGRKYPAALAGALPDLVDPDFEADDRDERAMGHLVAIYQAAPELQDDPKFLGHLGQLYMLATGGFEWPLFRRLADEMTEAKR